MRLTLSTLFLLCSLAACNASPRYFQTDDYHGFWAGQDDREFVTNHYTTREGQVIAAQ